MDLSYPIGKYQFPDSTTAAQRANWIEEIRQAPAALRAAIKGLTPEQIETPYRPGGWTVRQSVHHVPESHMNSYIRFKLTLTEDEPTVKPYDESKWAVTPEVAVLDLETSLTMLDVLHTRWVALLTRMTETDFLRHMRHPEIGRIRLDGVLGLYAWHGKHHIAHITGLRERNGWS